MSPLPTVEEILANANEQLSVAYRALGDAGDWLRSDWAPLGSPLTAEQAEAKAGMRTAIATAKAAINRGRP